MIPGINLLDIAFGVIDTTIVQYEKYLGHTTNATGLDVVNFADPVEIEGSLQPIKKSLYEQFGLQFQKTYFNFYVSQDLLDIGRNVTGDRLIYDGNVYQCESSENWFGMDGWVDIRCVLLGPVELNA